MLSILYCTQYLHEQMYTPLITTVCMYCINNVIIIKVIIWLRRISTHGSQVIGNHQPTWAPQHFLFMATLYHSLSSTTYNRVVDPVDPVDPSWRSLVGNSPEKSSSSMTHS